MLLRPVWKRIALSALAGVFAYGCGTSSTVTQQPNPVKCQVTLASPPMMDAGGGAATLAITTQTECAWDVSSNVNWISAISPASGQGPATVSFRVAADDGTSMRDGLLVVNGAQAQVSQRAPCRYDVGPSSQNVGASGGTGSINITTTNDCSWTAASDSNWIVLGSSTSGSGNGSVSVTVAPNQGSDTRSGAIVIANQPRYNHYASWCERPGLRRELLADKSERCGGWRARHTHHRLGGRRVSVDGRERRNVPRDQLRRDRNR